MFYIFRIFIGEFDLFFLRSVDCLPVQYFEQTAHLPEENGRLFIFEKIVGIVVVCHPVQSSTVPKVKSRNGVFKKN